MKDLPILLKFAIVMTLVLTWAIMIRQLVVSPSGGDILSAANDDVAVNEDNAGPEKVTLYAPIPDVLPDLNDGYLFNSERTFAEEELAGFGALDESDDLSAVTYSGSLIVGEIYKGLITFQESISAGGQSNRAPRGRSSPQRTSSDFTTKQLSIGDVFRGFQVEKIDKDRIVFTKGSEVVERFLYDANKERAEAGSPVQSRAEKPGRTTPEAVGRVVQQVPTFGATSSVGNGTGVNVIGKGAPASTTSIAAKLSRRRSELLQGLDPSLGAPVSPGVPTGTP